MKIMHIVTLSELGGAQSVVIELANHAVRSGHMVYVMSDRSGDMWRLLDGSVRCIKTRFFTRRISPIVDLLALMTIAWSWIQCRPDIVHLHSSKIGCLGRLALCFFSAKIVYTVHGFDSIRVAYRRFLPIEQLLSRFKCVIVPVSEYDKRNLLDEGIRSGPVILNGVVDMEESSYENYPGPTMENPRARIVSIARIDPQKRFDLFVRTACLLPDICFVWIGNKNAIDNLPNNVFCAGQIPFARKYLRSFDLFLLPSNYEGLPISILEALCAGMPVVASNVGGVPEVIDSNYGKTVDNMPDAMASAVCSFLDNSIDLDHARKSARSAYEKAFSVQHMWYKYLSLYRQLLWVRTADCKRPPAHSNRIHA